MNLFKTIITSVLLSVSISFFSQSSWIGKSYESIKSHLDYIDKDNLGTSTMTRHQDGEVSEIFIYYYDYTEPKCGFISTFAEYYTIKNNVCVSIKIDYNNMSPEKLKSIYAKCYADTKLGKYYFNTDYTGYRTITKDLFGNARVLVKKTELKNMPSSIRPQVSAKLKETEEKLAKEKVIRDAEEKAKKEITSKIYNLKEIDLTAYESFMTTLTNNFIEGAKDNNSFPTWSEIKEKYNNNYEYKSTYSAHYKRIHDGDNGYFKNDNKFSFVSGENKSCSLIKEFSPRLNAATYKNYKVMTEVVIENFPFIYTKGITVVSIKKGAIVYTKDAPNAIIKEELKSRLLKLAKGKYEIKYQYISANGETKLVATSEKIKSTGSKLLNVAGGYAGF